MIFHWMEEGHFAVLGDGSAVHRSCGVHLYTPAQREKKTEKGDTPVCLEPHRKSEMRIRREKKRFAYFSPY